MIFKYSSPTHTYMGWGGGRSGVSIGEHGRIKAKVHTTFLVKPKARPHLEVQQSTAVWHMQCLSSVVAVLCNLFNYSAFVRMHMFSFDVGKSKWSLMWVRVLALHGEGVYHVCVCVCVCV